MIGVPPDGVLAFRGTTPATVDIDTSSAASAQESLAWIVLALFVVGAIYVKLRYRYWSLDESERRHLKAVRPALARGSWRKIPIKESEERGPRYQRVARALAGTGGGLTARRAVGQGLSRVRGAIADRMPGLPPLAVRAAVEGVALLLLGTLLAISADQWQGLLFGSIDRATGAIRGGDLSAAVDALSWLISTTVPGGGTALALGATVVILLYGVLLDAWLLLGIMLIALSIAVVELDRRTPTDLSPTLYPDRRRLITRAALWIGALWVVALIGEGVARASGSTAAGVALVVLAAVVIAGHVGRGLVDRLLRVAGIRPADDVIAEPTPSRPPESIVADAVRARCEPVPYDPLAAGRELAAAVEDPSTGAARTGGPSPWLTLSQVIVRQAVGVLALVAFPVLLYVGIAAVGTGRILGPLWALGAAPWYVLVLLALAGVVGTVAAIVSVPALAPIREWCRRRIATGTVRSAVAVRGIPVAAAVIGALIGWAYLGVSIERGTLLGSIFALAVVMGVTALAAISIVLLGRALWDRIGISLLYREFEPAPPTDQVVEVLDPPATDADGRALYIARVDGRPLAWPDRDGLLERIERVVDERFESGHTPHLVAHELYLAAADRGVVDPKIVFHEVRGDLDTRIESTLADHDGELDYGHLRDELEEEYPARLVDAVLRRKQERNDIGVTNGRVELIRGFRADTRQ